MKRVKVKNVKLNEANERLLKKSTTAPASTSRQVASVDKKDSQKVPKFNAIDHWKGMPEFVNENKQPVKQIIVGFANAEDMHRFAKLVNQPITAKTRSIWYPKLEHTPMFDKRYVDSKPTKK